MLCRRRLSALTACSVRVLTNSCRYPSICHVSSRVACNGCLPLLPLHDTKVGSHWVFSHLASFAFYGYIPIAFLCAVRDLHTRVDFRRTRYFRWRHTWFRQRILPMLSALILHYSTLTSVSCTHMSFVIVERSVLCNCGSATPRVASHNCLARCGKLARPLLARSGR